MYESNRLAKLLQQQDMKDKNLDYETFLYGFEAFLHKMNMTDEKKQLIVYREDIVPRIMHINS